MIETLPPTEAEKLHPDAQKRVHKIKKFYKKLASWAGTSIFLVALDLFFSGSITWSKFPVFFWGGSLLLQFFTVLQLQRMDKAWEEKLMRKFTGRSNTDTSPMQQKIPLTKSEDFSEELLQYPTEREKEMADLSRYRKIK